MKKQFFVTPLNDGEAVEIKKMLDESKAEYATTSQTWGASWEGLEDEVKKQIKQKLEEGYEVYGIELQGEMEGTKNIDHHKYGEVDRSNEKSSIEQVAEKLGIELDRRRMLIAANDKGYIPAMKELGATEEEIKDIRKQDRAAQGITKEQELEAERALKNKKVLKNGNLTIVEMGHSKCAPVTDAEFGKYENLAIFSSDGETNIFGPKDTIDKLNEKFKDIDGIKWSGEGFWGSSNIDQKLIKTELLEMIPNKKVSKEMSETKKEDIKKSFGL